MQKPSQRIQWLLVLGFLDLNALEDLKMEKKFKFKNNIKQSSQIKMWFLNKKNKNLGYKI